jgi:dihydroneopterin aldolase
VRERFAKSGFASDERAGGGMMDEIVIGRLELQARIGITENERAAPQRLVVSITMEPQVALDQTEDDLSRTVDYAAVCAEARMLAKTGERRLIETLAHELAMLVLERFAVRRVEVEVRKFAVPGSEYVAVRLTRTG